MDVSTYASKLFRIPQTSRVHSDAARVLLGLSGSEILKLRPEHLTYLAWHRERAFGLG